MQKWWIEMSRIKERKTDTLYKIYIVFEDKIEI